MPNRLHPSLVPLLAGVAVTAVSPSAGALSCAVPAGGLATDADIVVTCPHCTMDAEPVTQVQGYDATTGEETIRVAVEEVERTAHVEGGVGFRFRASDPLAEGNYTLETSVYPLSVSAVADMGAPQIPVARLTGYYMVDDTWGPIRNAQIELSGVNGVLVVDEGEPDDDPMQNLEYVWQIGTPDFTFAFGLALCSTSYVGADFGVETRVRFGTLAPSGEFSGWSDWLDVRFPEALGRYTVDEAGTVSLMAPDGTELPPVDEPPESETPATDPPVSETPENDPGTMGGVPMPIDVVEPVDADPNGNSAQGETAGLVGVDGSDASAGGCAVARRGAGALSLAPWMLVALPLLRRRRDA